MLTSFRCLSVSWVSQYTPAIDIWSIGCIFSELLTGKPLFPGKNVVHQLDLITDLLGTPSLEAIARVSIREKEKKEKNVDIKLFMKPKSNILFLLQVRNEKARRYLSTMRRKKPIPFSQKFPNADPLALCLLERMLAFEPKDRPSAEEVRLANSVASFAKNRLLSSFFCGNRNTGCFFLCTCCKMDWS